jgi:hypothetical protein
VSLCPTILFLYPEECSCMRNSVHLSGRAIHVSYKSVPFFGHVVLVSDSVHVSKMLPYLYLWEKKQLLFVFRSHKIIIWKFIWKLYCGMWGWNSAATAQSITLPLYILPPPLHMTGVGQDTSPNSWPIYVYWVLRKGFSVPWIAVACIYDWHCVVLTPHHHHQLQHHLTRPWVDPFFGCQ